jgi:TM2 domain-containing membrane protein YozV
MYSVIGPEGQTYGPVELETLKMWCAQGRINSDTFVIDPIDGSTRRASDLPEVAQYIQPPALRVPTYSAFGNPNLSHSMATQYPRLALAGAPPKSKLIAILLALFLGALGIHRFYMGHIGTGIAMLLITVLSFGALAIVTGLWALIDMVLIGAGVLNDGNNRPLAWS